MSNPRRSFGETNHINSLEEAECDFMHILSFTFGLFEAVFFITFLPPGFAWGYSP